MATYNIIGQLHSSSGNGSVQDLTVNLYQPAGETILASAVSRAGGFFQFVLDAGFMATYFPEGAVVELAFEVIDISGDTLLSKASSLIWTPEFSGEVQLYVDSAALPAESTYHVKGEIAYANGVTAAGRTVRAYRQLFREQVLLGSAIVDEIGNYFISYNATLLDTNETDRVGIAVEVFDTEGITSLGRSDVHAFQNPLVIDFILASDTDATDNFSDLFGKLAADLGGADIAGVTDEEVQQLSIDKGMDAAVLTRFVKSHQLTDAIEATTETDRKYMYALFDRYDLTETSFLQVNHAEIADVVANAITSNTIAVDSPDVTSFVAKIKDAQVNELKAMEVSNEAFTWGEVLVSAMNGEANATSFLSGYNDVRFDTGAAEAFWSGLSDEAKKGFKLIPVSGVQPKTIDAMLAEVAAEPGIHVLAEKNISYWQTLVNNVCTTAGELVAPTAIKAMFDETDTEYADKVKAEYAKTLKASVQEIYPMATIKAHLDGTGGGLIIEDATARDQVVTFLSNNRDFDLRSTSTENIDGIAFDLTGITDVVSLKDELLPFQRLLNITGGSPDAVVAFKSDGLLSANAIASMNEEAFVNTYAEVLGGSKATEVFVRAGNIDLITEQTTIGIRGLHGDPDITVLPSGGGQTLVQAVMAASPDLVTLFGNMNYCACQHCISLYSPAAYLTDLLKFLRKKAIQAGGDMIYQELCRRRPDLVHIELTCKNTNTQLPYIDLVNEVLENYILEKRGTAHPVSYQTSGTSDELRAHPEHVESQLQMIGGDPSKVYVNNDAYEEVYNSALSDAKYPGKLPFNLALEETRTYLGNLGASRHELMKLFKSVGSTPNDIDDFGLAAEYLGISHNSAKIITAQSPYNTNIWEYYGFKVENSTGNPGNGIIDPTNITGTPLMGLWSYWPCERLDVMIQQLRITYKEFLQLLVTDFLNKDRLIGVALNADGISKDIGEDTCDLQYLKLVFTGAGTQDAFFARLHRFIRLWQATGMSIYELDMLVSRFLGLSDINDAGLVLLTRVLSLCQTLKMKPEELAAFWCDIDTHKYINYNSETLAELPSVYEKVFVNKAVINIPIDQFKDPQALPPAFTDQTALIAAFCRIKESELNYLMDAFGVPTSDPVTLPLLSRFYFFGVLSKTIGVPVTRLLNVRVQNGQSHTAIAANSGLSVNYPQLQHLESLAETISLINASGFSFEELDYLLNDSGAKEKFAVKNKDVQAFYEGLRKELQKFPVSTSGDYSDETLLLLRNTIIQYFGKHFGLPDSNMKLILESVDLQTVPSGTVNIIDGLSDVAFIASAFTLYMVLDKVFPALSLDNLQVLEADRNSHGNSSLPDFYLPFLYDQYYLIHKIAAIAKRLAITEDIFNYVFANEATIGFDFMDLPVNTTAADLLGLQGGLLRLFQWLGVQELLKLTDEDFVAFLEASSGTATTDAKANWMDILSKNPEIEMVITDLVGVSSTLGSTGLLHLAFNTDVSPSASNGIAVISKLTKIAKWCDYTGLSPQHLCNVLKPGLVLADAHHVLLAAKAKYDDKTWLKVAKPLRDSLRKKQRDALSEYIIANPVLSGGSRKLWKDQNELFAYFLIDVEMDPCMMTSRSRQALNSVQLMVDRVMLGIEYHDYATRLELTGSALVQWEKWRKWYRVWEANRKVFLYPENWIEPDLRMGKSAFFEELESDLKQDDFSDELAGDAYRSYLEKLAHVARLEPVGAFREYLDGDDVPYGQRPYRLHTFARTYGEPHVYHYRTFSEGEWTPWQKIDVEIASDHIMPYMYNGRLYLFWLTFQKKSGWVRNKYFVEKRSEVFLNDVEDNAAEDRSKNPNYEQQYIMEITLNWIENKQGKWLEQKSSKDKMQLKLVPGFENYKNSWGWKRRLVSKNEELSSFDILKSQIHMSGSIYKALNFLDISVTCPHPPKVTQTSYTLVRAGFNEYDRMEYVQHFRFTDPFSEPVVERLEGLRSNFMTPHQTVSINNKFVNYKLDNWGQNGSLHYHITKQTVGANHYVYTGNYIANNQNYIRSNAGLYRILGNGDHKYRIQSISNFMSAVYFANNVPGNWMLVAPPQDFETNNPLSWDFFYEDTQKTFFVTNVTREVVEGTSGNLGNGMFAVAPVYTMPRYLFRTFYHPYVKEFIKKLNTGGIESFLNLSTQCVKAEYFPWSYAPDAVNVVDKYPVDNIDFEYDGAYSCYNWELFFHAPLMIAQRLADNQKFAEARKWYHYIFDPTSTTDEHGTVISSKKRFWKFRPFYEIAENVQTLSELMEDINKMITTATMQVAKWEDNAFDPHAVARVRHVAYMKNVVMKYLDNLIAWADQLFKQDTVESINEATQLYILAANILGKRPEEIPARVRTVSVSFDEIKDSLDDFSNAKVAIEKFIDPNVRISIASQVPLTAFYFCLPNNDKLLSYWNTVADRLFKIRHCMNISGAVRELSLFGSPIDPAALVKAAAAGIDTATFLQNASSAASNYKFSFILQKANELCGDVKSFGSALLNVLEKKDAEGLALLRSSQEMAIQEKITQVKELTIQEADVNIAALNKSIESVDAKLKYYSDKKLMNSKEESALKLSREAMDLQRKAGDKSANSATWSIVPMVNLQFPWSVGTSVGGANIASSIQAKSTEISTIAALKSAQASMSSTMGGYLHRYDEWKFQEQLAGKEKEQLLRQLDALNLKRMIAEKELENHRLQIENSRSVDEYMRSKFTNEELYSWMISQISTTYFQSYQLAYEMAKIAERCFEFELPFASKSKAGYIQAGYWDSLKKGLHAGEKLQYDLRQLERAYIEGNKRDMELTKHVSLLSLDPEALIELREKGKCYFTVPEWLYNLDYPGHYHRRIRSVSITIPCVAGPYTTIACQLELTGSTIYEESGDDVTVNGKTPLKQIATSSAQNDNGMFEMSFRDERYMPFEGCGAESQWALTLMKDKELRQFDYNTISDIILHIKYTAQGLSAFESVRAIEKAGDIKTMIEAGLSGTLLTRYFSMRHEFTRQMYTGFTQLVDCTYEDDPFTGKARQFTISINQDQFPYFCKGRTIRIAEIGFYVKSLAATGSVTDYVINTPDLLDPEADKQTTLGLAEGYYAGIADMGDIAIAPGATIQIPIKLFKHVTGTPGIVNEADIENIFMVFRYIAE